MPRKTPSCVNAEEALYSNKSHKHVKQLPKTAPHIKPSHKEAKTLTLTPLSVFDRVLTTVQL